MPDQWAFDFSGWKRKDLKEFRTIAASGDEDGVLPFYAKTIQAWPFEHDPADVASYDELGLEQWADVNQKFADALTAVFQRTGKTDVSG